MSQTGMVAWEQSASSNDDADSGVAWPEGMAPSAVNDSARAEMASVAKWRDDSNGSLTTGGSSTAYTLSTNQSFSTLSYLSRQLIGVVFHATNGASPTLNVDGLGAKSIALDATSVVPVGAIRAGTFHLLHYDASNAVFIVVNGHSLTEPGRIATTAASAAPNGWLLCDGSAVSRSTYADLFAAISTTYGTGNGSTTFNVPDLRGRVAVGKDNMGGSSANRITNAVAGFVGTTLGATGGDQRLHQHNHTVTDGTSNTGHRHDVAVPTGTNAGSADSFCRANNTSGGTLTATNAGSLEKANISLADAGAGSSQNVQPSIILNFIIKT